MTKPDNFLIFFYSCIEIGAIMLALGLLSSKVSFKVLEITNV